MSNYFRKLPNIDYVSRLPNAKIGDYMPVKNLFKKGALRDDIFQNISFFEKYKIRGDDRPDNVAFDFYEDSNLDWLVLTCNNIINIQSEWPLPQQAFDRHLFKKYTKPDDTEEQTYDRIYNGVHHYETVQVKTTEGVEVLKAGLQVSSDFSFTYYDWLTDGSTTLIGSNIHTTITNYEYEDKLENDKRNIFLLKPTYLGIVLDDLSEIMQYKKGSTEYVSKTLKRAENIRLYQ